MINQVELLEAKLAMKRLMDSNIVLRSAAIALGIYDKAIEYLPELLIIISESERGREIIAELGIDDIDGVVSFK